MWSFLEKRVSPKKNEKSIEKSKKLPKIHFSIFFLKKLCFLEQGSGWVGGGSTKNRKKSKVHFLSPFTPKTCLEIIPHRFWHEKVKKSENPQKSGKFRVRKTAGGSSVPGPGGVNFRMSKGISRGKKNPIELKLFFTFSFIFR